MFCIQGLGWSAVFFARVSVLFPASDKDPTVEGLLKAPLIYTGSKKVLQSLVRGYLGSPWLWRRADNQDADFEKLQCIPQPMRSQCETRWLPKAKYSLQQDFRSCSGTTKTNRDCWDPSGHTTTSIVPPWVEG